MPLGSGVDELTFDPERLTRPFPLTRYWIWEGDPDADRAAIEAVFGDGLIWLGTDGCAMYWALVVTGAQR